MARTRKKPAEPAATAPQTDDTSFDVAGFDAAPDPEPARTHAESVGKREPQITRSGLTCLKNDLLAGVVYSEGFRLLGGRKVRDGVIAFAERPSPDVIAAMNDANFEWRAADKVWTFQIRPDTAMQDRIHGERVFERVAGMIREERNIEHSAGMAVG